MINIANISGLIGATLMLFQILLSNRFVVSKINPNLPKIVKLHILLGIYGFFFILLHPFLEVFKLGENLTYLYLPNFLSEYQKHITFGKLALLLYLIIWVSSAILRKGISYRLWHYIHYLTYFSFFFVFIHAFKIGTLINTYPLLKSVWIFLGIIYLLLLIQKSWQIFNLNKISYILVKKEIRDDNNVIYTFKPQDKVLNARSGQFFYITLNIFGESHPFSLMKFNENTNEIIFGIKTVGKFSKKLLNLNINSVVYLDGPYGTFTKEAQNSNPKVILAGGIGITPFISLIEKFADSNTYLFYGHRKMNDLVDNLEFLKKLGKNFVEVVSQDVFDERLVIRGRVTKEILLSKLSSDVLSKANFFICGSTSFTTSILEILSNLKINKKRIFTEEFSF